ncbi:MAG TPA: hypothetical protein DDW99_03085 [Ruminococcaceae bacterium]|jgi:cytoskeletal protein CcmA (bactofilin family)|nr:hypothetical protein [Oscillospiraceae bacterium]
MDAAGSSQDSRFAHIMKRIWNGPEEAEEPERPSAEPEGTVRGGRVRPEPEREAGDVPTPPAPPEDRPVPQGAGAEKDATIISKGTSISGDIKSDGDVEMRGTVTGSIDAGGKVRVSGRQIGDVQGASITLSACTVRGNLSAAEDVGVDSESVVVGDIKCGNLSFDGKLKGNIHVMGNVSCRSSAIVLGDIASTTLTVESGAKIQGNVQVSDGTIDPITVPDDDSAEPPAPTVPERQ